MNSVLCDYAEKAVEFATIHGAQYCDVRAESQIKKSAVIENGLIENTKDSLDEGLGIRFLKNGKWGFCSFTKPESFDMIKNPLEKAINHTKHYSENKIILSQLCAIKVKNTTKNFPVLKKPEMEDVLDLGLECSRIILENSSIKRSIVNSWYTVNSKYFVSSEGTHILQNFTDVITEMVATAHESGLTQSINITEGGRGGMEQLTKNDTAQKSAAEISRKAVQLLNAKPVKEEKAQVVMNPDFVSLLTHEILGHPSEADRVLGKEMAWAGGSWWKNKIGEKIGSEHLNVFDDPTIKESLGWYYFDDEGVETSKTQLVDRGILKNHMQNRETASVFRTDPTGNMRATNFRFMPLIRMACTCIGSGDWKADEIVQDVKEGYLVSNMKVPSIDMKRHNWSISCQYAQKIENGELTDLLRDVIVIGVAPEFFQSIDACGDDFTVRPITNCGKGDPMQSMIMGNGGPTIRGIATVKSVT